MRESNQCFSSQVACLRPTSTRVNDSSVNIGVCGQIDLIAGIFQTARRFAKLCPIGLR